MTDAPATTLLDLVCPQCHAPQRVRDTEWHDPVCYLCHKCLHVWDTTATTRPTRELQEYAPR